MVAHAIGAVKGAGGNGNGSVRTVLVSRCECSTPATGSDPATPMQGEAREDDIAGQFLASACGRAEAPAGETPCGAPGLSSSRTTGKWWGASMPMRTEPPETRTTVTAISSPIQILSPVFLESTSMRVSFAQDQDCAANAAGTGPADGAVVYCMRKVNTIRIPSRMHSDCAPRRRWGAVWNVCPECDVP